MSLNTLLESANPYHSMQSDAAKLKHWERPVGHPIALASERNTILDDVEETTD